jgi:hypothetical protein
VVTAAAVGLAILLTAIDRWYPDATTWLGWAYGGGAAGARELPCSRSTNAPGWTWRPSTTRSPG